MKKFYYKINLKPTMQTTPPTTTNRLYIPPKQSNLLLEIIPIDVLSNHILGQYCTGRSISTFTIVLEGYYFNSNNTSLKIKNNEID